MLLLPAESNAHGHRGSVAGVGTGFLTTESLRAAGFAFRETRTARSGGRGLHQASRRRGFTSSAGLSAPGVQMTEKQSEVLLIQLKGSSRLAFGIQMLGCKNLKINK